jgi:hypothetical protein
MMYWLVLTGALILLVAAVHLALCLDRLRGLDPIPGEARVWFRPFIIVPLVPLAGLAASFLAPEGQSLRYGLGVGAVAAGLWLAQLFAGQYFLYRELASARERRALFAYTAAMFASAEAAVVCLLYYPVTGTQSPAINLVGTAFGACTMNLIVASLHHRAIIQDAEKKLD